jgi:hypothetical protein
MTKHYFIILIEDDEDADFFEKHMNQNNIDFDVEIIGNTDLIYEFKINIQNKSQVKYIINMHCIPILDFKI